MTAAMVMQMNSLQSSNGVTPTQNSSNADADFSKILKNSSADMEKKVAKTSESTKSTNEKEPVKASGTDDNKTQPSVTEDKAKKADAKVVGDKVSETDVETDVSEEVMKEAGELAAEMMMVIQNVLNVPIEDIQSTLESLDMQPLDLLNPNNMTKVVLALQGTDETALITDEALFGEAKLLTEKSTELLNQIAEKFEVSPEKVIGQIEEMKMPHMQKEDPVVILETSHTEQTQISQNTNLVEPLKEEAGTKQDTSKQSTSHNEQKGNNEFNFSQTIVNQLKDAVTKVMDTKPMSYTTSTESIMNQVNEMLKVTMKEDITEMELSLHPASLGNVRVQVAAKDGVITASFTTQNEIVKAALESQIMVLKDNLSEQGIKVEAVEVMVSSHAFERNLNEEGEHTSSQSEGKKKTARKINLNQLTDSLEEEQLEQEDRIVADMMRKNGNSVDYTA